MILAAVYTAAAYPSFSSLAAYARASGLWTAWGAEVALAVAVDGLVVFAFLAFRRNPVFATALIIVASGVSFWVQELHSLALPERPGPYMLRPLVAAIPQAAVVLAAIAWHLTRTRRPATAAVQERAILTRPEEPEAGSITLTERTTTERSVTAGNGGKLGRALELLRERGELLPVSELAAAAGVSERTAKTARRVYRDEAGADTQAP